jgi:hypothetical protein
MSNILKALNENSLADQLMKSAKKIGLNPRLAGTPEQERERTQKMLAQREKDRAMTPKQEPQSDDIELWKQELKKAKEGFDSNYDYSDDNSYWREQNAKAKTINHYSKLLKDAGVDIENLDSEKDVTDDSEEIDETKEVDYDSKYQDMVKRVGQLAKEGPRKTVYDPVKKVYKTVPVNKPKQEGVAEGEVVPFKQKNPLTPNLIKQLKALSQQALELFWEGSYMPTAAQGQVSQLGKNEEQRMFKQNEAAFKALGYEYSIVEDSQDLLYLHSIAREAWYDADKPANQYRGLPDLQYNAETNTLSYYDLIGDDGYEYNDNTQFEGVEEGYQDDTQDREENLRYSRSRNPVADAIRKKLNPNQKEQNKEQGVAEGLKFHGGFPDVDHMRGAVHRDADMTTDNVKTKNKKDWDRAVDSINARVFDDMAEFRTDSKGERVTGNSAVWAKWDNATQTGWFNAKGRPLKPWPVKEQGVAEGSDELYQKAIRKYVQRVADNYLGGGDAHLYGAGNFDSEMFGVDPKQAEQDFDKLFPQYVKQLQGGEQGVAESSNKNVVKSVKVGNFRHNLVDTGMGWQVRIYNGDELYDTGLSKNSLQKGLVALEDAVAYMEKQTNTKRQGVAEGKEDLHTQLQAINQKLKLMKGGPVGEPNSVAFVEKRKALLKQKEQILSQLKQGVAEENLQEVSDDTLIGYLNKVEQDVRKHKSDPTKRSPEKANRSVQGFSRAFNKLDARKATDLAKRVGEGEEKPMRYQEYMDKAEKIHELMMLASKNRNQAEFEKLKKQRDELDSMARKGLLSEENKYALHVIYVDDVPVEKFTDFAKAYQTYGILRHQLPQSKVKMLSYTADQAKNINEENTDDKRARYIQAAKDVLKGADFDHLARVRNLDVELLRKFVSYAWDKLNSGEYKLNRPDLEESFNMKISELESNESLTEGENWSKYNNKRAGGMSKKSVKSYRRSHPGSKIQTAVTKKPSKIKKGSKDAKRRKSFCARMKGMKKHRTSAKTAHDPNSNINKSLRRWHCESIEDMKNLIMIAEQKIAEAKNLKQQAAIAVNMKKAGKSPKQK